ncbi:MAG: sterol desaturase family protein [Leptospirales bacterium]|nr:sterol desaturase family protein [Leptospirales bacterium]
MDLSTILSIAPAVFLNDFLRYSIPAFGLLAILLLARKKLTAQRIQNREIRFRQYAREFGYSMSTVIIYASAGIAIFMAQRAGLTRIYLNIEDRGWVYFVSSIVIMIILHDGYFYWTHRLMHSRILFKTFHRIHHLSRTPSPLAAYAFSPFEALVQLAIFPMIVFVIPAHPIALFIFPTWMILRNVLGHSGYEFFPAWFATTPVVRSLTTAVHHDMHHDTMRGNYGLYFRFWDRMMGTENPLYELRFSEIANRGGKK